MNSHGSAIPETWCCKLPIPAKLSVEKSVENLPVLPEKQLQNLPAVFVILLLSTNTPMKQWVGHHEVKHIKPYGRIIRFTSISK